MSFCTCFNTACPDSFSAFYSILILYIRDIIESFENIRDMKILRTLITFCFILIAAKLQCQELPPSYQAMLNEIVTNFETIRTGNSVTKGSTSISVLDKDKIALRVEHKKSVKNLTFIKQPDEESQMYWVAANQLTTDMVNKYEDYLTKTLESMLKLSEKKSNE